VAGGSSNASCRAVEDVVVEIIIDCSAGHLVERVSDRAFDDYLDNNIFKPLAGTAFELPPALPALLVADAGKGYRVCSEPAKP